ncbi:hypothetical protein OSTOST_09317 [Ostertagia ostertagi]
MTSISASQPAKEPSRMLQDGTPQITIGGNAKQFTTKQSKMMCEEGGRDGVSGKSKGGEAVKEDAECGSSGTEQLQTTSASLKVTHGLSAMNTARKQTWQLLTRRQQHFGEQGKYNKQTISENLYHWMKKAPKTKGLKLRHHERITVLRDIVIACIAIIWIQPPVSEGGTPLESGPTTPIKVNVEVDAK